MEVLQGLILLLFIFSTSFGSEPNSQNVINPPQNVQHTLYVDGINGRDWKDGKTESTALKTLQKAMKNVQSGTQIIVKNGNYQNYKFGSGNKNNPTVLTIQNKNDILLTNFPGHNPKIRFDGSGGIMMNKVNRVEIRGFEIVGPNNGITKSVAMEDRLLHSKKFSGRGIAVWSGTHIRIHNNTVHHCPNSGIRVNKGDYIAIEDNVVYGNTWWSSNAESAIVVADARHIDNLDITKIFLCRNRVYGNRNYIPYYNANYEDSDYLENHQMHVARPNYGTSKQNFIIDGSGVYVTRNSAKYLYGRFELSYNKAYRNGINGLVVHKTDRARVIGNILWDNGQVSKDAPESRQPYAGLTLNSALDVEVRDNFVETEFKDDYAYVITPNSKLNAASGNNKVCKVVSAVWTGYGTISPNFETSVSKVGRKICQSAKNS